METSEAIRKTARNIVMVYAHHIKDRVNEKDEDYLQLGIDNNFLNYEELFKTVISKVLGVSHVSKKIFSNIVLTECIDVINDLIDEKGYTSLLESTVNAECTYTMCLFILNKVKEEEFSVLLS